MSNINDTLENYREFTNKHHVVVGYVTIICSCGDHSETVREHWHHIGVALQKAGLHVLTTEQLEAELQSAAEGGVV